MLAIGDADWTLYAQISRLREGHSALDDAKILKTVCAMKSEEMLQNPYGYTFIDTSAPDSICHAFGGRVHFH